MKLDRVNNTKKGIFHGLINSIIGLVLPFIIQTMIIRQLGLEYAGIKGLFSSILMVFSLAELGFGSAVVYAMYEPIATDDTDSICSLLGLYRKVYKYIGLVIILLGFCILPFLKSIIKGSYPNDISIEIVFLLYLLNTAISYLMYGYKSSLLIAYQRNDVISIISTIVLLFSSGFQIAFLYFTKNFYLFLSVSIVSTVINNIITGIIVDKMFPEIRCRGVVSKTTIQEIRKKVYGLLIAKVGGVTRNSFDSIFMTAFLGLIPAAIYSNYFLILSSLNVITTVILYAMFAGVGNSIVLESKNKN